MILPVIAIRQTLTIFKPKNFACLPKLIKTHTQPHQMLLLFINAATEVKRPNDLPTIIHEICGRPGFAK